MLGLRNSILALVAFAMSGCMVGPDFQRPDAPQTSRYTDSPLERETVSSPGVAGAAQRFVDGADLPAQWWSLYRSEPLDRLIREGLADSPTLDAARATLRQAQENLTARTGALMYPAVDANASATREKLSNAEFNQSGATPPFNLYNASVNVSYMLDIFGGNRRQLESLAAVVDYQSYQLEGAHLALTGNIVTAAIREAGLRAQIQSTRGILAAEQETIRRVARQFELGGVGRLELVAQQAQAAQTEATLPPLENQLAQTRHLLAVLTGKLPSETAVPEFNLDTLHLPEEIPVTVPSELVRQRPDIRASEALLHQASAQIGVATAALYPQINLTASFGAQSNELHNLFAGPSLWSLGAGLLQPLFHGGELEANRRAAIAAYEAAEAQYRDTVLQAFRNVADALRVLEGDARTVKAQTDAEALARDRLELTRKQYQLGGTSYIALLDAQREYNLAQFALVLAQANRYADTAALFQALGGGWWKPDNAASAQEPQNTN
ncbi:MAG TPA: efflux transporter outer membrane subunit [Casimicrobiaceae bacterium]|nr:efflux transporter outer membrane subunit [Casimicrobiaceae bacterium]